ncbi:Membrane dipeptidase (Peptidase family M19) [Nannocystis exedens]|uniref:Membrane dipeptidase (Peptidase family M19) n=1 Tax=Nannocystis exedens TaxID=54 RepID=A0A1I2I324_9BACT|nr:membrane dipeptidase [Nannocystis exedens]PCC74916.1 Membrane dipeptidase (Peptidase family M19) [Nannocystis exedens]SFF36594.1 Membrane dipeptidase (Peptidase family M19) [Nannocystis exedens]
MIRGLAFTFTSLALLIACTGDTPAATDGASTTTGTATGTDTPTGTDVPTTTTGGPELPPLHGIADLHLHMFAEEAFGGGWFHGGHAGPGEDALAPCDGGEPGDHGRLKADLAPLLGQCEGMTLEDLAKLVPLVSVIAAPGGGEVVSEFVSQIPGSTGDTGEHKARANGWPGFEGWPRWDAIAHQQVWEEHLHAAYMAGLRLEVISAVSNDWLCRAIAEENLERPQCDEMEDVKIQLELAHEFVKTHDWAEIALTAADARRIVGEDRLALVLSVEASHLMNQGDWKPQLDELYDLGVRTLQPVHQLDNRFGGAAPHNNIFHIAQYAENCHIDMDCGITQGNVTLGFDVDADCRNTRGLTAEGEELVSVMMDRGMLVDAAHLSEQGVRDLHELAVARDYYPYYISHGHFREMLPAEKAREEKTTPAWIIEHLRQVGGVFGLRTGHEEVNTYEPSEVANTCHGSSRSFAQSYDFARLGLKVAVALGSDLNGFIQQVRPRFGVDACSASFPTEARCQARDELAGGPAPLGTGFDEAGLGHIGLLPDLLADLDRLGTDTTPLRDSADAFVRMWERAEAERSGPADPVDDLDAGGVVVLPPHNQREAEFPSECGDSYCEASLQTGEPCRFDGECVSGTCADAGECGTPKGTCA